MKILPIVKLLPGFLGIGSCYLLVFYLIGYMGFSDFYDTIKVITISEILSYSSELLPIGIIIIVAASIFSTLTLYWLSASYNLFSKRGFGLLFFFFIISSFWTGLTLNRVLFFAHSFVAYGFFSSIILLQIIISLEAKNRKITAVGMGIIAMSVIIFVALFILYDYRINGIEEVVFMLTTNVWLLLISLFTIKKELAEKQIDSRSK
ncbi:MAG: hypothetical protein V1905_02640 [bacterium]